MDVNTNFPAGCPFFYGYVIAAVCTGIKIAKAGGQNNLLGYATDDLLGDTTLQLSRVGYSSISATATLIGALVQPGLGLVTDQLGGRVVLPLFLVGLVGGLGLMSVLTVDVFGPVRYPVAVGCFAVIRGLAIGGLDTATNANINQWFIARRGRVMAVSNVCMTLGQLIVYSQAYQWAVGAGGWRATFQWAAGFALLWVIPAALLLRRTPESCGCQPDFRSAVPAQLRRPSQSQKQLQQYQRIGQDDDAEGDGNGEKQGMVMSSAPTALPALERAMTLRQAMRTPALWLLCSNAATWGLVGSGFDLHMISIISENTPINTTVDLATSFAAPQAIVSSVVGLVTGVLIDRGVHPRFMIGGSCISLAVFALLCSLPHYNAVNVAMGVSRGVFNGMRGTVAAVVYADFYGRQHTGAISSVERVFAIAGAAAGPVVFAAARELTGEFLTVPAPKVLRCVAGVPLVLGLIITAFLRKPADSTVRPSGYGDNRSSE